MDKVTAELELSAASLDVVREVAAACGLDLQTFLNQCLLRGIMAAEDEYWEARVAATREGALDDDLPF